MRSYWWLAALFVTALVVTEVASDALYARATWGKEIDENEFTGTPLASPPALKLPAGVARPADDMSSGIG
ncbi:MAG TPA: hypothetical protein VMI56_25850 [Reyranella sp.]|nr:hypothetical protein [Reyranella sp.]